MPSLPSYKIKKEKHEAKKLEMDTPSQDTSDLVNPSTVSVIGVVIEPSSVKSPALPPEKKAKKEKTTSKAKKLLNLLLLQTVR